MIYNYLIQPFADEAFRRAMSACLAMSLGSAPLGVFMVLRRMSMAGDTLSHGIFSGVAIAFVIAGGVSFWPMTLGGILAGFAITLFNTFVKRNTNLKEDASFAGAYMLSLALGVLIITTHGGDEELIHILFGDALKISGQLLNFSAAMAALSVVGLAVIYRPLIIECVDPVFMRSVRGRGAVYHQLFLILVVVNLVASFQALGTLMALGLMILPAISARLWSNNIDWTIFASVIIAAISSIGGLLVSYHTHLSSGPCVVMAAGIIYFLSIFFGKNGILIKFLPHYHLAE